MLSQAVILPNKMKHSTSKNLHDLVRPEFEDSCPSALWTLQEAPASEPSEADPFGLDQIIQKEDAFKCVYSSLSPLP